jgi:hypothetical protein
VLVSQGFMDHSETEAAIEALVTSGLIERAVVEAAVREAEELLEQAGDDPPAPGD